MLLKTMQMHVFVHFLFNQNIIYNRIIVQGLNHSFAVSAFLQCHASLYVYVLKLKNQSDVWNVISAGHSLFLPVNILILLLQWSLIVLNIDISKYFLVLQNIVRTHFLFFFLFLLENC